MCTATTISLSYCQAIGAEKETVSSTKDATASNSQHRPRPSLPPLGSQQQPRMQRPCTIGIYNPLRHHFTPQPPQPPSLSLASTAVFLHAATETGQLPTPIAAVSQPADLPLAAPSHATTAASQPRQQPFLNALTETGQPQ